METKMSYSRGETQRNAEFVRNEMKAFGLEVAAGPDQLLRQQIVGAVAAAVALAAMAGLAALLSS
jgi:hypothetical protein